MFGYMLTTWQWSVNVNNMAISIFGDVIAMLVRRWWVCDNSIVTFSFNHGITIYEVRIRHACGSVIVSNESCMNRWNHSCEWNARVLKIYFFCHIRVIYKALRARRTSQNLPSSEYTFLNHEVHPPFSHYMNKHNKRRIL